MHAAWVTNRRNWKPVQRAGYYLVAIMETWWDHSYEWSAAMSGYRLFRRDRQHRRGGGVALYIRECFDVVELEARNDKVPMG